VNRCEQPSAAKGFGIPCSPLRRIPCSDRGACGPTNVKTPCRAGVFSRDATAGTSLHDAFSLYFSLFAGKQAEDGAMGDSAPRSPGNPRAMSGGVSLLFGQLFDRFGFSVLIVLDPALGSLCAAGVSRWLLDPAGDGSLDETAHAYAPCKCQVSFMVFRGIASLVAWSSWSAHGSCPMRQSWESSRSRARAASRG
jgi:hypothetical protein